MKLYLIISLAFILNIVKLVNAQDYSRLAAQFASPNTLNDIHYGFSLYDLDEDSLVFGIRENQFFTPASNTKVYTLFSSLVHLGDSILGLHYVERGDSLIFWGTGDPTFLHPKFANQQVYHFLKNNSHKLFYVPQESLEGSYRNGWSIEDYQEYYQPDVASFPIYGNLVTFKASNGIVVGTPSYFTAKAINHQDEKSVFSGLKRDQYANIFRYNSKEISPDFKTSKPFIWSDSLLVTLLVDTLKKDVQLLKNYDKPKELKTIYSVKRDELLREMMLPSDNFFAEQLTMLIAQQKFDSFDTESLRKYMQSTFYKNFRDSVILRDGSGLSTYNKITPRNMVDLLLAIHQMTPSEDTRNYFFPTGGIDGTLRNAYQLDLSVPFVWAKTGTINSVHCQSGYLETRSGKRFAFSFLNNNYAVPTSEIRKEMVRIITYIRQNY